MPSISEAPSAHQRLLTDLTEELNRLDRAKLRRRLTTLEAVEGAVVRIEGQSLICWCSNDYLGLSTHPRLIAAASDAAARWGIGARASRLLAGTSRWHVELEASLATWFGAEAAIVFPSGYLANLGILHALLTEDDAVFVDRLAHASLIDAARSSRAAFHVFRHNDATHLAHVIGRARGHGRRLIVTEGVFSMDGDLSCLNELMRVAEAHDALVYLDDAHGAFVLGARGRGTPEALGVPHERLLYMGTLGKALGCQGGFLIGPQILIDVLHNRARPFIYATAPAVPIAAAAVEALRVLRDEPERRQRLQHLDRHLQARLTPTASTQRPLRAGHIVPVLVGSTQRALVLSAHLRQQGHWAPAIRPPTVPKGTARLRLSVTAAHSIEHVESLALALQSLGVDSMTSPQHDDAQRIAA